MRATFGVALCAALASGGAAEAAKPGAAKVSFLSGEADVLRRADRHMTKAGPSPKAPWKGLAKGAKVREGDAVRTAPAARVELTLPDGSRVRLGGGSQVVLDKGHFAKSGEREVSFTLWLGRIWAKVAKRLGDDSTFEVETQNAVAGVRGTSFTVVAHADLSSVVKVYAGAVGVKKEAGAGGGQARASRREVPGPKRIDRAQWEEVVATAMKQVQITSLGQIQPAEDFVDSGEELEWAMWNRERDAALQ